MKQLLAIGSNLTFAHNMARDILDDLGEEVVKTDKRAELPYVKSKNTICYFTALHSYDKPHQYEGSQITDVYVMADLPIGVYQEMSKKLNPLDLPIFKLHVMPLDEIPFTVL